MKRFYESKDEKEDEGEEEATKRSPKKPKVGELHRLSCFRESPLISQNEGLVNQLAIIRKHRYLIYSSSHHKFIAYATAVSSIISYPYEIKSKQEALTLPNVSRSLFFIRAQRSSLLVSLLTVYSYSPRSFTPVSI